MTEGRYDLLVPAAPASEVAHEVLDLAAFPVHVERIGAEDAPVRVIVVHGAGGNAEALRPYARHLAALGTRVTVPDLPGYGLSLPPQPGAVRYDHWRAVLAELVRREDDDRPLVLFGASIGGMLAYDTAAATGRVTALAVTCLLDPRSPRVRDRLAPTPWLGRIAGPLLRLVAGPLAGLRVPLRWVANMRAIANDPRMVALVLGDRRGGGGRASLGWMRSYLGSAPVVEPEASTTPLWLVHPADDRWTPVAISREFAERIAAPVHVVLLDGCGHFPLEQPGFDQMIAAVRGIIRDVVGS